MNFRYKILFYSLTIDNILNIVVLLILAATSISMLTGENGIIKQAQDAKENTDYTLDKDGEDFIVTYTDSERSYYVDANGKTGEVVEREGLKVGDYINYIPDENTEGYTADKLISTITGASENTSTITQDQQYAEDGAGMTWQILRIYADGRMDLIGSETNQKVYFQGINGYNNRVNVMNDICETLYSRGDIKARSVNYEDVEYWLTDEGKAVRDAFYTSTSGVIYGHTQTYTSIYYRFYPSLYAQEIGSKIDSGLSGLTATQTYWVGDMDTINFGEGYNALKMSKDYWVASRYANCNSSGVNFGLRVVSTGFVGYALYGSNSLYGGLDRPFRPVVTLSPNTQIETCTGENGIDNMHKIIQY